MTLIDTACRNKDNGVLYLVNMSDAGSTTVNKRRKPRRSVDVTVADEIQKSFAEHNGNSTLNDFFELRLIEAFLTRQACKMFLYFDRL